MAIAYIDPSTNEPVVRERWRWVAVYQDGTQLEQFTVKDNKATFHKFAEIDQSNLYHFKMVNDGHRPIIIELPERAQLIHYYVTARIQTLATDGIHTITTEYKGYKVGYKLDTKDIGVLINHDDSVFIINDFKSTNLVEEIN